MKHTYLLDTNIVMAILRGGALAERLEAQYHLRTTDKDFCTFSPSHFQYTWIDPKSPS